jgi:dienelactone hydrolase
MSPYWLSFARCRFERGEKVVKVTYDSQGNVAGLFFLDPPTEPDWTPPPYVDLSAVEERVVLVGTHPALPGVLTTPKGPGPFPAVVLVHGSGPQDADETIGRVKVFKDLALGLAMRGVAVLRYVKRTRAEPLGVVTVKEEVLDAVHAAVDLLSANPQVDPKRIVVLGHSLGGYLAPRIASEDARVAVLVILAGNTRPLQDLLVDQVRYLASLAPQPQSSATLAEALELKAAVEDPQLTADRPLPALAGGATGAYFIDLRGYHPEAVAARLSVPMLIVRGERDYQVGQADFEAWKGAVCGEPRVQCKQYPGLNHAFVEGTGPSTPAEYLRPGHVDALVIEDTARWVQALGSRR